ncbi:MAG: SIR2 family protein [Xanthomonadaceae bacterium]|nr:SIR2 family protein [Xanthomonadaceae bacterium]
MHDLGRVQRDLQESLSLDKHPVALLLGAGCPLAVRVDDGAGGVKPIIPDIRGLTKAISTELAGDASFKNLRQQFVDDELAGFTIEDALSRVRLLSRVAGNGTARGLSKSELGALEAAMCKEISKLVRAELSSTDSAYHKLVDWISGIARVKPLQLFTTNYDLLIEQALEDRQVPYFDGFIGSRNPFFDIRAIEEEQAPTRWARLWKLHGSINWKYLGSGVVCRCFPVPDDADGVLIHPSELKYDQSRRMPYLAMLDRLRNFLKQPSAFFVTIGYSFADEHLNEVIIQGLRGNPTAACFGLLFGSMVEEKTAQAVSSRLPTNVSLVARDSGLIRGVMANWAPHPDAVPEAPGATSDLGDFSAFAAFVRNLSPLGSSAHA